MAGGPAVARVGEHPGQQLLRRLAGASSSRSSISSPGSISRDLSSSRPAISTRNSVVGLEVEAAVARLQVVDVGDDDVGEIDLEEVELLAQHQRQQQVERPGEDVEIQLEAVHGGRGHGAQATTRAGRARRPSPGGRRRGWRPRSRAPSRRRRPARSSSAASSLAELRVALAHGCQVLGDRLADARLELAVPVRAAELRLDRLRRRAPDGGVDVDAGWRSPGLSGPRRISAPESVTARLNFLTIAAGSSSDVDRAGLRGCRSSTSCGSGSCRSPMRAPTSGMRISGTTSDVAEAAR